MKQKKTKQNKKKQASKQRLQNPHKKTEVQLSSVNFYKIIFKTCKMGWIDLKKICTHVIMIMC